MSITPIILCGGSGTRLWPASRKARPKQFLPLVDQCSTFQLTLERVVGKDFARPIVVTGSDTRFLVAEQAQEIGVDIDILLEPEGRDSGPALAAAAVYLSRRDDEEAIGLALASDHVVRDVEGFRRTVLDALATARSGAIVTFGIAPSGPSPDYGYIAPGEPLERHGEVRAVSRFIEKPDIERAKRFVANGYLWNSGNFLVRADILLSEYEARDAETIAASRDAVAGAIRDLDFIRLDTASFSRTHKLSIDYAVMEHTSCAAVIAAAFDWSDIGGWDAMDAVFQQDGKGNAVQGQHIALSAEGNIVSSDGPLVALAGVDNLVVVVTEDAVLVLDRRKGPLMRDLVARVRDVRPDLVEEHRQSFRPWGNYRSLDVGSRHQVKRIVVKPGATLSLQHHHHRAEHWIVVRGTARVTLDHEVQMLRENESVYIPLGTLHRMENPGKIDLEIIEVQTGSYLGEDDIVRHEDVYVRM